MHEGADMGKGTFLERLSTVVRQHRAEDPTAPVTVLVSSAAEVMELRTALARVDDTALYIGVSVVTALMHAGRGVRSVTPEVLADVVRRHAAEGYFAALDGLAGVADALTAAVLVWDAALPQQRADLVELAPSQVDRERLQAVAALHRKVVGSAEAASVLLPGGVLAGEPRSIEGQLWVDATVTALTPIEWQWLRRLREAVEGAGGWVRLDPADAPSVDGRTAIISAVDPFDECGLVAREVTSALESGVPARDLAVVVPASVLGRYRDLIGGFLDATGVPHDGGSDGPGRVGNTRAGSVVVAFAEAVSALRHPRDHRFDHLAGVISAGGLPDAQGGPISTRRLKQLWQCLRGTDPASWREAVVPRLSVTADGPLTEQAAESVAAAAVTAGTVARALEVARVARSEPQPWVVLGDVLRPLLPASLATSEADGLALARLWALISEWEAREGLGLWSQAREELIGVLGAAMPDDQDGAGVRIVALSQGWAVAPRVAVAVALSDDIVPGTQGAVGPLTADEVAMLRTPAGGPLPGLDDDRCLRALADVAQRVTVSYPRSDQLRTIVRQPSRFLGPELSAQRRFGSVSAQFDAVDAGTLGLLGPGDAAASLVRSGGSASLAAELATVDLVAAAGCTTSRRHPPGVDGVDAFNGDVRGLSGEERAHLSPDFRAEGAPSASPSGLESLLGCPIGWWAKRVVGVGEPEDWDPAALEQPNWGTWLHRALVLLSEGGLLLAEGLTDADVAESLWSALGGRPAEPLDVDAADPEVLGYRFRVTDADLVRATREVRVIASRLRTFLAVRGGTVSSPVHEALLPAAVLTLESGPLHLAGRVDRIDGLAGGRHLITDYKTGRPGAGFQLAVYGWLWLLTRGGITELLYATTADRGYEPTVLVDGGPAEFTAADLEDYLRERLTTGVGAAREGVFGSRAWAQDHNRYCPVCADLAPTASGWSTTARGERAGALAAVAPLEVSV